MRYGRTWLVAIGFVFVLHTLALGQEKKIRVLYVGGDWKAQLSAADNPMRGHFIKREVDKIAPGRFDFALWTSYEFLQYGDAQSLGQFDVVVAGDVMGQSVTPRLVEAVNQFVREGGGFWYCDNHKSFSFLTKERSLEAVLPLEVVPFRAYHDAGQPTVAGPVKLKVLEANHPILKGLDPAGAPPLGGARYGKIQEGATVLATAGGGEPIWVARGVGKGRSLWTGGVFANDEWTTEFSKWPQFGQFYVQALTWLAGNPSAPVLALSPVIATGTLTIDLAKTGPSLTSKHFGIHGQETAIGSYPMEGEDLQLYKALNLDGTFARTSSFMAIKKVPGGKRYDMMDDGTDLTTFDAGKYDFTETETVLPDLQRIKAEPLFLYWVPWKRTLPDLPDAGRFTKYFAAAIEHINGNPKTPQYKPRLRYFEIMNEPNLGGTKNPPMTHEQVMSAFTDFTNHATSKLSARYPGMLFGVGGFHEWPYLQAVIERCGKNLSWISRHPYGLTGEAVFDLHDAYLQHARSLGLDHLKFIITEWDFWIYGEPSFDYIMQRWKPLAERADTLLAALHFRWREYEEGGYVFGLHGEFNKPYGRLPPQWPNPGKNMPITYRYNAFWAMRHARGTQHQATLDVPALNVGKSTRAYAIATSNDQEFSILVYYGYPQPNLAAKQKAEALKLRVRSAIPPQIKGRTLVISRADARKIVELPPRALSGDTIDMEIELPALSALSLTVR